MCDLFEKQGNEVCRVKGIAHLSSGAAKTDVFERFPAKPGVNPVSKNPLVGPPELAGARQNAAPVDPDRKSKSSTVFERKDFGRQLAAAV